MPCSLPEEGGEGGVGGRTISHTHTRDRGPVAHVQWPDYGQAGFSPLLR